MNLSDYHGLRICAVPDHLGAGGLCKWPFDRITYAITDVPEGLPWEDYRDCVVASLEALTDVCGAELAYQVNARTAHVLMGAGHIDGPAGTLAWSELPCGDPARTLRQRYDGAEAWWLRLDVPPANRISLPAVLRHEWGHALGLEHGGSDLMAPTYNPAWLLPGPWTISQLRLRYGPPRRKPVPPVPPPIPKPIPEPSPAPGGPSMWNHLLTVLKLLRKAADFTRTDADDKILDGLIELVEMYLAGKVSEDQVLDALAQLHNP